MARTSLDSDVLFFLGLRKHLRLRYAKHQNTVLKLSFDILLGDCIADIEAPAVRAAETFAADIVAFLVLFVLVVGGRGGNREISVVQLYLDVFFLYAREIDIELISVFGLSHIGLHHRCSLCACGDLGKIEKVIKHISSEHIRYKHKS